MTDYFISIFVNGKCKSLYFAPDLDDLVTIKAIYGECEVEILDVTNFERFTEAQVEQETLKSGKRWKKERERARLREEQAPPPPKPKKEKPKKFWDRPIRCVETGRVFYNIRECCDVMNLPYKSVWNAINSGNERCGFHFVNSSSEEYETYIKSREERFLHKK